MSLSKDDLFAWSLKKCDTFIQIQYAINDFERCGQNIEAKLIQYIADYADDDTDTSLNLLKKDIVRINEQIEEKVKKMVTQVISDSHRRYGTPTRHDKSP